MSLSKEDADDLRSLIERFTQTEVALNVAKHVRDEAERQYLNFITTLQFTPRGQSK